MKFMSLKIKNEDVAVEAVLYAILETDEFKAEVVKIPEQMKEHIRDNGYSRRLTDYLLEALDNHFEQDLLDVVKPNAVFKLLHDEMKIDIAELDAQIISRETVKDVYGTREEKFEVDRTIGDILEAIHDATRRIYEQKLDEVWKGKTPDDFINAEAVACASLSLLWEKEPNTIYILPLDKDRKLTREPYSDMDLTVNTDVALTAEYKQEEQHYRIYRDLHVAYSRPITTTFYGSQPSTCIGTTHSARKNEVNVVTITT